MTDSERIIALKNFLCVSFKKMADDVGLATVQTFYDIKNGKHGISKDVAQKIQAKHPNISLAWLLTGTGEMLSEDNSTNIKQHDDNIPTSNHFIMSEIKDIKKFRKQHGLTQRELAERCGVTLRTVQNWEIGRTVPESAMRLMQFIDGDGETISSSSTDNGISVAAGNGSSVNVGSEAARLIMLLEKQQEQTDEHLQIIRRRDEQIDRLIGMLEKITVKPI